MPAGAAQSLAEMHEEVSAYCFLPGSELSKSITPAPESLTETLFSWHFGVPCSLSVNFVSHLPMSQGSPANSPWALRTKLGPVYLLQRPQ